LLFAAKQLLHVIGGGDGDSARIDGRICEEIAYSSSGFASS
jgi:hypothetical protein